MSELGKSIDTTARERMGLIAAAINDDLPQDWLGFEIVGADGHDGEAVHSMPLGSVVELAHVNFATRAVQVRNLVAAAVEEIELVEGACVEVWRVGTHRVLPHHLRALTLAAKDVLEGFGR